jgi:hypothetical protein
MLCEGNRDIMGKAHLAAEFEHQAPSFSFLLWLSWDGHARAMCICKAIGYIQVCTCHRRDYLFSACYLFFPPDVFAGVSFQNTTSYPHLVPKQPVEFPTH